MVEGSFDPRGILAYLERARVNYVLIGSLARALQGTDETARGVDICPQARPENLERLRGALAELEARPNSLGAPIDIEGLGGGEPVALETPMGPLRIVAAPAGTRRGWDDLRRGAGRESLGGGLRVAVASVNDLVRMEAALGGVHPEALLQLRQIQELDRSRGRGLDR